MASPILAHAEDLAQQLISRCFNKECASVTPDNAFSFIKTGMELVSSIASLSGEERKECLIMALELIAKGKDGIAGNEDDLLAPETVHKIEIMIKHNIIGPLVEVLLDAAKGRMNIDAMKGVIIDTAKVSAGCFDFCMSKK